MEDSDEDELVVKSAAPSGAEKAESGSGAGSGSGSGAAAAASSSTASSSTASEAQPAGVSSTGVKAEPQVAQGEGTPGELLYLLRCCSTKMCMCVYVYVCVRPCEPPTRAPHKSKAVN